MPVSFVPGYSLQAGDLYINFQDTNGLPANVFSITYNIYYVDPGPPETEVLIPPADRAPVNSNLGLYYASFMVPPSALPGNYRIRWTFQQTSGSAPTEIVQEFEVIEPGTQVVSYSQNVQALINRLRILLRDQCIAGEEEVLVRIDGEVMSVRMQDLWEAIGHLEIGGSESGLKDKIQSAFLKGSLETLSVSDEGEVCWRKIMSADRAEVPWESVHQVSLEEGGSFIATAGHRVFVSPVSKKEAGRLEPGDEVLSVSSGAAFKQKVVSNQVVESRRYMYDLTVDEWHNFILKNSGACVSNSPDKHYRFCPPEHEGRIGKFNRVFGYVWEDYELHEYLQAALDWWNMSPPETEGLCSLDILLQRKPVWKQGVIWGAIVHAMFALATNWVKEEFSVSGDTLVKVQTPDLGEIEIPIEELFQILKG